jgi:hypothetical protein
MTDYSNKVIPTLDDVIDDDQSTQTGSLEAVDPAQQTKPEESGDSSGNSTDADQDASDDLDNDDIDNKGTVDNTSEPHHATSSPFYETPGTTHASLQISYQEIYDKSRVQHLDQTIETASAEVAPIDLDTIVESVTEQIMPELEQKLKSLIQQVLTEKLPEEIIKSAHDDSDSADDGGHIDNI